MYPKIILALNMASTQGRPQAGARWCTCTPGCCYSVFCRTLSMHRVWYRVAAKLFSTEWNTTANFSVPQVGPRH